MRPADYEQIAASYNRRYETNNYDGIEECLRRFLDDATCVAEVGCGTGHWLALAASWIPDAFIVGLDRAAAMLAIARNDSRKANLVRGSADQLPWGPATLDRVFCVNALHHFPNPQDFYLECARVLRNGGAFITIGLDPHVGTDQWWIYDYFPAALAADLRRYPSTASIRAGLTAAGFTEIATVVAQHMPAQLSFDDAKAQGFLERNSASQLSVIDDVEWTRGLEQLLADRPLLRADLRLYATVAWRR
jgi:SAM-dependent methyltransferase